MAHTSIGMLLYADALYLPLLNKKLRQNHQQVKQAATQVLGRLINQGKCINRGALPSTGPSTMSGGVQGAIRMEETREVLVLYPSNYQPIFPPSWCMMQTIAHRILSKPAVKEGRKGEA